MYHFKIFKIILGTERGDYVYILKFCFLFSQNSRDFVPAGMSLRQAFKSKFRQEKPEMDLMTAPTILQTYPSEEHLLEEITDEVIS